MDTIQHTQDLLNNPFGLAFITTLFFASVIEFFILWIQLLGDIRENKSPIPTIFLLFLTLSCCLGLFIKAYQAEGIDWIIRGWFVALAILAIGASLSYLFWKKIDKFLDKFVK